MFGFFIQLIYRLMLITVLLVSTGLYLLGTNSGLVYIVKLMKPYVPGELEFTDFKGEVLNGFSVSDLNYKYKDFSLIIKKLDFSWANKTKLIIKPENLSIITDSGSYGLKFKTIYLNLKPKQVFIFSSVELADNKILKFKLSLDSIKNWQLRGNLTSAKANLRLTGDGSIQPFKGNIYIRGKDFPIYQSQDYSFDLSPDLKLNLRPDKIKLRGNLVVPRAEIKPKSFMKSVTLSDDVTYVTATKKKAAKFPLDLDINIQMGEHVELKAKGLQGLLAGQVRLKHSNTIPLTATGELLLRDGKYTIYDKELVIEQGRLIYTGHNFDNPEVHVRATKPYYVSSALSGAKQLADFKKSQAQSLSADSKTIIGVEVDGQLKALKMHLFSIPASLSQADILSMLILGVPANQASQAGGKLLLTAFSALNIDSNAKGMQLLKQLKHSIGVDFSVENSVYFDKKTNQDKNQTSIVLGKSLSKRLYLSYNMALSQVDNSVLTLSYLFNQFFSLQVDASKAGNGIDVLYTRSS